MQCLRLCYPLCARHVHGKEVRELNTSAQDNRREVIPRSNQSPKRFGNKLCQKATHLAIVNAPLVQPVLQKRAVFQEDPGNGERFRESRQK